MTYRNPKLLAMAREAPVCFRCQATNVGQVVAAHSNQLRDGKGRGHKAADFRIAYLCNTCHTEIDEGARMSRQERVSAWEEAHRHTIGWLFSTGRIVLCETRIR